MALGRNFGFVADATLGGSNFDTLAGVIPAPTKFWPLSNFNVEKGLTPIERNNEMRGVRGNQPPQSFRQAPSVTLQGNLYNGLAKKLGLLITGDTDARTGTPPAAITHALEPVGFGPDGLRAIHLGLLRDGLYEQVAGSQLGEIALNFPNDELATFEGTLLGLYRKQNPGAYPAVASFDGVTEDWVMVLRDARVFIDDSITPMTGIRNFTLTVNNQFRDPDFDAGLNVEEITEAGDLHRIWWPNKRRLGSAQAVTGNLDFSDVKVAEDKRMDLQHAQKIVFEVAAQPLTTTPVADEMFRVTLWNTVYTGGGVGAATREDDIQTSFEYGAFLDSTGKDFTLEYVDASNLDLAL